MTDNQNESTDVQEPHLALPVGTQIVTRITLKNAAGKTHHPRGSVGVIVEVLHDDWQHYRIRFPDSDEVVLHRADFGVRKHLRQAALQRLQGINHDDLYPYVIYRCVVGSRAMDWIRMIRIRIGEEFIWRLPSCNGRLTGRLNNWNARPHRKPTGSCRSS